MAKAAKPTAKKKVPAKKAASKNEIGIKYADKSTGQEHLVPIFDAIVKMMKPYEKAHVRLKGGKGGQVAVVSEKKYVVEGRERDELWFAASLVQKGYVGFYMMAAYDKKVQEQLHPDLLRCLKGKTCFHIKKFDKEVSAQIAAALKTGYRHFKDLGWM
jgi:hypothetical protein